ncbi:hypothetical protein [Nonomuraea sp. bgisy101]|uniref:hypothetical protein n=1 Tax=Nonomuraea sp. bgisy101 TaxID=3413784 RepID=UPI003D714EED
MCLDLDVTESGFEQQVVIAAGGARVGGQVGARVHDGPGEPWVVGVDDEGVPVLADEDDAPARGQETST